MKTTRAGQRFTGKVEEPGNRDIEIPAETIVRFKLADDLVVQAP